MPAFDGCSRRSRPCCRYMRGPAGSGCVAPWPAVCGHLADRIWPVITGFRGPTVGHRMTYGRQPDRKLALTEGENSPDACAMCFAHIAEYERVGRRPVVRRESPRSSSSARMGMPGAGPESWVCRQDGGGEINPRSPERLPGRPGRFLREQAPFGISAPARPSPRLRSRPRAGFPCPGPVGPALCP